MTTRQLILPQEDPTTHRDMMILWRVGRYATALSLIPPASRRAHWLPRPVNPAYLPYHRRRVDPVATTRRRKLRESRQLRKDYESLSYRMITLEDI